MKIKILLGVLILSASLFAQTTTVSASSTLVDRQGNPMSGSTCFGSVSSFNGVWSYSTAISVPCFSFSAGVQAAYAVPNGTYDIWINETSPASVIANSSGQSLFVIKAITLSGTPISVGTYLQSQFGISIGGTYFYPALNQNILPLDCSGQSTILPGSPLPGFQINLSNSSSSVDCALSGGSVIRLGSAMTSLPAQQSMILSWNPISSEWLASTQAIGAQGPQGIQGVTGSAGAPGAQGIAGTSGTNGTNGATGSQGATGSAGSAGATGSTGATGATGPSGTSTASQSSATRSFNTCFQVSATRPAEVHYTAEIGTTLSLTGGTQGQVTLNTYTDSACTLNTQELGRFTNGNTGALTIGLNIAQTLASQLNGWVATGLWVKLLTTNTTGTPTFTYRSGQEVLF